jgi:hypothetical protein
MSGLLRAVADSVTTGRPDNQSAKTLECDRTIRTPHCFRAGIAAPTRPPFGA